MLKLKPFIYSPSVRPHRRLASSPVADKISGYVPVKSLKYSPHQHIHYFPLSILPTRRRLIHRSFSVSMESSGVNTTSPSVVKLKPIEATSETFKEFGQVIEASPDGEEFGPHDAQLDLSNGIPRFYIMQLKDRSLKFSKITHHANVTQCLGSIGGNVWYLGVAKPSIVDPTDFKGAVDIVVQSNCGHFYVPPAVDEVQAFRISGPNFIKLNHGTWHAGPLFTDNKMDFYNLELNNTNVVDHTTHDFIKKNGVVFDVYLEYEKKTYAKLINSIEAQPSKALQAILKSFLAKIYKRQNHTRIVQCKTSYYSFYLPVACALLMAGENLDNHVNAKEILIKMGIYYQVQDDYLDCFADSEVLGKDGTDIQDFKCSWLVVKALEHCNEEQKKLLHESYGNKDGACVAKVKALFNDLKLEDVYLEYEKNKYEELINSIEDPQNKIKQSNASSSKVILGQDI